MLRDEIASFTDGNNLIAPNRVTPGTKRGSDNGPMFTAEYFIMLRYRKEETPRDAADFRTRLLSCLGPLGGILHRAPGAPGQEGPDDYYGILAGCRVFGFNDIASTILDHGLSHWGFLNTPNPEGYTYPENYEDPSRAGKTNWDAFLFRQPQLVAAMYSAANRVTIRQWPLFFVAAVSIAISGWRKPPGDGDSRRLAWLLVQTVASTSWMCWLASKIFYWRLKRDYGQEENAMREVAKVYYRDGHPFQRYWMDQPPGGHPWPGVRG